MILLRFLSSPPRQSDHSIVCVSYYLSLTCPSVPHLHIPLSVPHLSVPVPLSVPPTSLSPSLTCPYIPPSSLYPSPRCEALYHLKCLDPPITVHPRVEWYCPSCVEQKGTTHTGTHIQHTQTTHTHKQAQTQTHHTQVTHSICTHRERKRDRHIQILYSTERIHTHTHYTHTTHTLHTHSARD